MKLTIKTPASSANLGPGFDALGLALEIWGTVTVETVSAPRQHSSIARLVQQGIDAAYHGVGDAPPVAIEYDNAIPLARGLGASAALRAAGVLAGNTLLDGLHGPDVLLEMGAKLEGHPDNVAPAFFGGLQVVVRGEQGLIHTEAALSPDLKVVVFVPDFEMPTQESRRRLPKQFAKEDMVFNVGRVALLLAALQSGRYELLDEATQDRIHQPVRSQIFKGLAPIMQGAKEAGAAAAYLSGGGSTVAAFVREGEERVARLMTQAALAAGFSGRSIITQPSARGAYVESKTD